MAANVEAKDSGGYWQSVQLTYGDGFKMNVILDRPTITKLENGDTALMDNIRHNYQNVSENTQTEKGKSQECSNGDNSGNSEVEEDKPSGQTYVFWSRDATQFLISLYKENEEDLENPRNQKRQIWQNITQKMNEAGYQFSQNKIESKWRSLVQSHKSVLDNKKQTGQKRRSFQYFAEMDEILAKRHDINPAFTSGSGHSKNDNTCTAKFSTKTSPVQNTSMASERSSPESSLVQSPGSSAKGKQKRGASETGNEILQFLQQVEKQRQLEHENREKRRDERAKERNGILKDLMKVLSKAD